MIRDLALADAPVALDADVGVVGGGTVGLVIADRLSRTGLRVVVLESGSGQQTEAARELNEIECTNEVYAGAQEGRARGLGGTSQIWGGALIPFLPVEFGERPELGLTGWPVDDRTIEPHLAEIEQLFGVVPGSYQRTEGLYVPEQAKDDDFVPRLAKWPSFSRRNVARLLADRLRSRHALQIWLNATVVDFRMAEEGTLLESVVAAADGGKKLQLTAKRFVLCTGAIESTRLMLWLQRKVQSSRRFSDSLGRYFHDHLSEIVARLDAPDQVAVNQIFGFAFQRGTMRSLRYEVSPTSRRSHGLPGGFCHVSFKPVSEPGIDRLRTLLRSLQAGKVAGQQMNDLWRSTPYYLRMAYWLAVRRQLYWPVPSILSLHVVAEQMPRAKNRISLSSRVDRFGVPKASLEWSIAREDIEAIDRISERFHQFWSHSALGHLGRLTPYKPGDAQTHRLSMTDIYHPGGSTRMGRNPDEGVVDGDLRVWGVPNLFIAATSTFPSGGAANPTMTLLQFGLRLADRLSAELSTSPPYKATTTVTAALSPSNFTTP